MLKILPLLAILFSGCSHFTINATICEQIAADPHETMPQECQNYSQEKAQKAFDKVKNKKQSNENVIQFTKKSDDN